MKAVFNPDAVTVNRFTLDIPGLKPILFDTVSTTELDIDTADMPDRTRISGGRTAPGEFTATILAGEGQGNLDLERWFEEAIDPIAPGY